ncbi:MAG: catalase [Proteiniphilum sp.]
MKKENGKKKTHRSPEKKNAVRSQMENPGIAGKGAEPAKVSMIELKDPLPVEMSEADKKISLEVRPLTPDNAKQQDLAVNKGGGYGNQMTTNQGLRINDDSNTLKAGERGPSLLEDFIMREKITHFDHERIPERIVHARGSGAHGVFKVTNPIPQFTKAKFLTEKGKETSVFVRFSTVQGGRGSTDMARDIRGFAVKFYTEEGIFDLVGNNVAPFFIQDAIKLPDLIHAVKPEPRNEIPQAASAHDTFWDFVSTSPETFHTVMWLMSDRAIPRSYRMMEGFGTHSFRFINDKDESFFVKFHWKPTLGLQSLIWDENQKIAGKDTDFHRRDLWDAIQAGEFPEWDMGVQIIPEADEFKFDFDLLDPTKLVPEELVPVQIVGRMTLNRNPDNFFAETEQVAFHPGHIVPGIDFSNDPLLQGRLFSYTDTQISRLGGPNFHEIPINRPVVPVVNNQRDGIHRMTINVDETSYHPNTISDNYPLQSSKEEGGFTSHRERIEAVKVRARSQSFLDHYSQPTLFYNSQTEVEKKHIADAFSFELGKVKRIAIRQNVLKMINMVDKELANQVAAQLGMPVPEGVPQNLQHRPDANPEEYETIAVKPKLKESPALSILKNQKKDSIRTRKIAILCDNGVDGTQLENLKKSLTAEGAMARVVASHLGMIKDNKGNEIEADDSVLTTSCVLFDALAVPDGSQDMFTRMQSDPRYKEFVRDTYFHYKPISANGAAVKFILDVVGEDLTTESGIVKDGNPADFIKAIKEGRYWDR